MNIPADVKADVERALGERMGRSVRIARATRVGGGCVSPVARVELDDGGTFFLKWGAVETTQDAPPGMLAAEADALRALGSANAVRVPEVLGVRDPAEPDDGPFWLLMEWLEPGGPRRGTWRRLGEGLAALHRTGADAFGWANDNFIGPLPQANGPSGDWPGFWAERRLEPQLRRAVDDDVLEQGDVDRFDRLFGRLDELLAAAAEDGPSLVHGDLWNGNVHVMRDGTAALVDPSAYHGHREVDLAMSELFGGFGREFYDAYHDAWAVLPEYPEHRRGVYQLYYLLVHVNLFGGGYVASTRSTLDALGF